MSKNSAQVNDFAKRKLDEILDLDMTEPHALPGSAMRHIKAAIKVLERDRRKRHDGREREVFKRGSADGN